LHLRRRRDLGRAPGRRPRPAARSHLQRLSPTTATAGLQPPTDARTGPPRGSSPVTNAPEGGIPCPE
jgi:hypothetical protein